jgi:hypothetical protein
LDLHVDSDGTTVVLYSQSYQKIFERSENENKFKERVIFKKISIFFSEKIGKDFAISNYFKFVPNYECLTKVFIEPLNFSETHKN